MVGQLTHAWGYNTIALRYDPVTRTVGATVNAASLGPFALAIPTPKFVAFEGQGVVDNFLVRNAP